MDNNFNQQPQVQPVYQQAPKQPAKFNMLELVALICSAVGAVMAILGTIFTCTCSASKTFDLERESDSKYVMSAVFIVTIIGVVIAIAGVVLAIVALKQSNAAAKAGKLSYIAAAVGLFAILYGLIPTITICGYNCSLDSAAESMQEEMKTMSYSDFFE